MYKDSKKKEKRVKILVVITFLFIFIILFSIFKYEMSKNKDYIDIWGEEKQTDIIEYYEEELIPTIINDQIIGNGNYINEDGTNENANDKRKNNYSDYYAGTYKGINIGTRSYTSRDAFNINIGTRSYIDRDITDIDTGTRSYINRDVPNINIGTRSNTNKDIPNYHTGKIFYNDINDE